MNKKNLKRSQISLMKQKTLIGVGPRDTQLSNLTSLQKQLLLPLMILDVRNGMNLKKLLGRNNDH